MPLDAIRDFAVARTITAWHAKVGTGPVFSTYLQRWHPEGDDPCDYCLDLERITAAITLPAFVAIPAPTYELGGTGTPYELTYQEAKHYTAHNNCKCRIRLILNPQAGALPP